MLQPENDESNNSINIVSIKQEVEDEIEANGAIDKIENPVMSVELKFEEDSIDYENSGEDPENNEIPVTTMDIKSQEDDSDPEWGFDEATTSGTGRSPHEKQIKKKSVEKRAKIGNHEELCKMKSKKVGQVSYKRSFTDRFRGSHEALGVHEPLFGTHWQTSLETNKLVAALLLEDDEDDELLLYCTERQSPNIFDGRKDEGCFSMIKKRLIDDETKFQEFFRVSRDIFHFILGEIKEDISSISCNRWKTPISAEQKLCVTLRFLSTGESYRSLATQVQINHSWISVIVRQTLKAIHERLGKVAIPEPNEEILKQVSDGFHRRWNFPHCCGTVGGKYIKISKPDNSGSFNFNCSKDFHSVVMLALVDHNYKFLAVDVCSCDKEVDAALFGKSPNLSKAFKFPPAEPIPGSQVVLPYVVLADEAFKLTTEILRPYPREQARTDMEKTTYNSRHCLARRVCENAFGILCHYFRIFYTPIAFDPDTTVLIVLATCALHNFLRDESSSTGEEKLSGILDLPRNVQPLPIKRGNAAFDAYSIRDQFCKYFCSPEGKVSQLM